jgi:F-type H+-transporting ATPase subunit gamma
LADKIIKYFNEKEIDKASLVFTKYYSAMSRQVEIKDIIPISCEPSEDKSVTVFEPSPEQILSELLPYNMAIQIYQAVLESIASEQSSRMTSMDSATRNADSLLSDFKSKYNRTRQLKITQELVEVISGAKAISDK